jgi:hypothetical protein
VPRFRERRVGSQGGNAVGDGVDIVGDYLFGPVAHRIVNGAINLKGSVGTSSTTESSNLAVQAFFYIEDISVLPQGSSLFKDLKLWLETAYGVVWISNRLGAGINVTIWAKDVGL